MAMNKENIKRIIEAALFAAGKPLSLESLAGLFEESERPARTDLRKALAELASDYADRGVELVEVASGWRFQSRQDFAPWIQKLWDEKPGRYSRATLETLALIAYRQPVTRGEIEEVRGVSVSSNIIKTLLEREWIRVVGHRDVPGRPALYATTRQFLDYFNLKSLDELPSLAELKDLESLAPELPLEDGGDSGPTTKADDRPVLTVESDRVH
jgi:segregation and condensation protein B